MTNQADYGALNRAGFSFAADASLRRALKVHCYRMLGSMHEAEDAVQETLMRGWRAFDDFEGKASFKNWLFRIATNVCLDALSARARQSRALPEELGAPSTERPRGEPDLDVPWLQPYPDIELDGVLDVGAAPDARYETSEAVRLAFVAAVQRLPPRQRAALILSDVMGWSALEIASLLGSSLAAINSMLQRARETMRTLYDEGSALQHRQLTDMHERQIVDSYVRAWEAKDLDGFIGLLKKDATYSMPPWRNWYRGRETIARFFGDVWTFYGNFRLLRVGANAQPAFGLYTFSKEGDWQAHSLQVLTLSGDGISALTSFMKPMGPALFGAFGLEQTLRA